MLICFMVPKLRLDSSIILAFGEGNGHRHILVRVHEEGSTHISSQKRKRVEKPPLLFGGHTFSDLSDSMFSFHFY